MKKNTSDLEAALVFKEKGIAHIKGTRLSVAQIILTWRQNYCSLDLTADYLEIPREIIEAAIGYYQKSSVEIDHEIKQREKASAEWR